jgi:signal transduction histidine kinase
MEHLKHSLERSNRDLKVERQNILRSNKDLEIFASVAAHDLKSPLQAIIGWLSVLDHEIIQPRSEQVDDSIQNIENAAKKSVSLINDLLDISRLNHQRNGYVDCDTIDLLKSVIRTLQEDLRKANAEVKIGELPRIRANPVQFETVFSNLIRNAINYRQLDRSLEIAVNGHENDQCFEFSVQDNGSGIHPDHHERIFDLFTRYHADDEHPGNGMGLAYCRKVVELMGGRIWVESQLRDGSTFKFIIPKA